MVPAPNVRRLAAAAALAAAALGACRSTPEAASLARKADLGSAPITHIVLVQLKDPTRTAELVAECDRSLPAIGGVRGYSCGTPLETGRSNVTADYDVGIYVGFATDADYRAYLDDPRHQAVVDRWREAWKSVRIFDFAEGLPASLPAAQDVPPAPQVPAVPPASTATGPVSPAPAPVAPPPVAPAAADQPAPRR